MNRRQNLSRYPNQPSNRAHLKRPSAYLTDEIMARRKFALYLIMKFIQRICQFDRLNTYPGCRTVFLFSFYVVTTGKPRFHGNQRIINLLITSLPASFKTGLSKFRAVKFRYFLCKNERNSKVSPRKVKKIFYTFVWRISAIFDFAIYCSCPCIFLNKNFV